jgi:hypothetical protein
MYTYSGAELESSYVDNGPMNNSWELRLYSRQLNADNIIISINVTKKI